MMNTIIARLHGLTNNPELCRLGEAHVDVAILLLTALASQSAGWIPTFATTWLRWLPLRVRFYSKRIFGTPFADATSASIVAMFQLSQERLRALERDGRIADAVQAKQLMNLAHDDALRKNDHLERDRTERDREIARLHRALQQAKDDLENATLGAVAAAKERESRIAELEAELACQTPTQNARRTQSRA